MDHIHSSSIAERMPGWTVIIRRADDLETDMTHIDYRPAPGATPAQIAGAEALDERRRAILERFVAILARAAPSQVQRIDDRIAAMEAFIGFTR